jgi:TPR repeat protein
MSSWKFTNSYLLALNIVLFVCGCGDPYAISPFEFERKRLIRLAESGDPRAQFSAGTMYLYGIHCEANKKLAIDWYKRSATNGNGDSTASYVVALNLDSSSHDGVCGTEESFFWLVLAAKQGNPFAQGKLALHYSSVLDPEKKYLACVWRNMVGNYDRIKIDHLLVKELSLIDSQFTDVTKERASTVTNLLRQAVDNKLWKKELLQGMAVTNQHAFEWTKEYLARPGIIPPTSSTPSKE